MEADGFSLHGGGRIYFASQPNDGWDSNMFWQTPLDNKHFSYKIGKKHALKKYDQLTLNTSSLFWGSTRSNITPVVQFHEIFVTKIINKFIYLFIIIVVAVETS